MTDDCKLPVLGPVRTVVASAPDREKVVWELWVDGQDHVAHNIADICYESGEMTIELFWPEALTEVRVSLNELLAALTASMEDFAGTRGL